jgi:hypothetical protein
MAGSTLHAQDNSVAPTIKVTDPTLTQHWVGTFGEGFSFPAEVKPNPLGTEVNKGGQTERVNFIIPDGNGSIKVQYFTEKRMVPKPYGILDSMRFADVDSAGRNGMIHRRTYILNQQAVQIDILLTDKGEKNYGPRLRAILDSFVPPPGSTFALEAWRYGRNPKEYEHGKTPDAIRQGK